MIYSKSLTEDPRYSGLIFSAEAYARGAHQSLKQVRKYTGEPYINHPARCAAMAAKFGLPEEAVAGLWLHDVAEDTGVTLEEIHDVFGERVYGIVSGLTNLYTKNAEGVYDIAPRARRHELSMKHLDRQSSLVKTCRMIDSYDNLRDILDHDLKFAKAYLPEKRDVWRICNGTHFQIHRMLDIRLTELEEALSGRKTKR